MDKCGSISFYFIKYLILSFGIFAQQYRVEGIIRDKEGTALSYVNIYYFSSRIPLL